MGKGPKSLENKHIKHCGEYNSEEDKFVKSTNIVMTMMTDVIVVDPITKTTNTEKKLFFKSALEEPCIEVEETKKSSEEEMNAVMNESQRTTYSTFTSESLVNLKTTTKPLQKFELNHLQNYNHGKR